MTSTTAAAPPPARRRGRTTLAIVLLAGLAISLAFAGWHFVSLVRSVQRLHRAPALRDPSRVEPWMPLQVVARTHRVPEPVLEDALRQAGFDLQPRELHPELPGGLPPRIGPFQRRSGEGSAPSRLLPVSRQSLRQIAGASARDESDAVSVVREAIGQYREQHPAPPGAPGAFRPPAPGSGG